MQKKSDWNLDKKVPISAHEFSKAVASAMNTEPFSSMANEINGIEAVFFSFGSRVGSILFEERTRVEK